MENSLSVNTLMLNGIRKTHPLNKKDEKAYFTEYLKTNEIRKQEIKKIIIESNFRFVLDVALKYKYVPGVNIQELFSEGKIGLLIAFDKFDKKSNLKFISYAVWWIRSRITKYLEQSDLIRLPTHQKKKLMDERKTKHSSEFGKDVYYLHELTMKHISLDDTLKDMNMPVSDVIKDDNSENVEKTRINKKMTKKLMEFLENVLKDEEILVISNLYGIGTDNPLPLRDVKDIIGKSHERVRQIRDNALRTLRKNCYNTESFKELLYSISDT